MELIELLIKIVNGEGLPKKIKYQYKTFELDNRNVYVRIDKVAGNDYGYKTLFYYISVNSDLNDEVEIIEEDKEIEFINLEYYDDEKYTPEQRINVCMNTIDKLIKSVNELKKGK